MNIVSSDGGRVSAALLSALGYVEQLARVASYVTTRLVNLILGSIFKSAVISLSNFYEW
jgi:hypothetical protein